MTTRIAGFDDRNIVWRPLGGMDGFVASILHVDAASHTVEFLIRFDPNTNTILHRHLATTCTFVIEGDHVIYETDGRLRESRPVGRFTHSAPEGDMHSEGGGPAGCTLLYSVRGTSDALFDVLDADLNVVGVLRVGDLAAAMDAQALSAPA